MRISAAALILCVAAFCLACVPARTIPDTAPFGTVCGVEALPTPGARNNPVISYRRIVINRIAACHKKLVDAHANVPAGEAQFCAPKATWSSDDKTEIYEKLYVCSQFAAQVASQNAKATPVPTPTALFRTAKGAFYVYASSAAPSVTGIDNPNTLLIWAVANQLQQDFFPDGRVVVVPEPGWTAADFSNQCEADPYDAKGEGTFGAIALTGATITSGSDFYIVVSKGWTHTDFTADLFDCTQPRPLISDAPVLRGVYNAVGQSYRTYVPLEPLAVLGVFVSTLHSNSTNKNEGLLGSAAVLALASAVPQLSTFNVGTATVPTVSVPRAYVDSAQNLSTNLISSFCGLRQTDLFHDHFCSGSPSVNLWHSGWPPAACVKRGDSDSLATRLSCNGTPAPAASATPSH